MKSRRSLGGQPEEIRLSEKTSNARAHLKVCAALSTASKVMTAAELGTIVTAMVMATTLLAAHHLTHHSHHHLHHAHHLPTGSARSSAAIWSVWPVAATLANALVAEV
jgi:hypothetical protein